MADVGFSMGFSMRISIGFSIGFSMGFSMFCYVSLQLSIFFYGFLMFRFSGFEGLIIWIFPSASFWQRPSSYTLSG